MRHALSLFFFFQAEDGIRDLIVTGVQTCALPICTRGPLPSSSSPPDGGTGGTHFMLCLNESRRASVPKSYPSVPRAYTRGCDVTWTGSADGCDRDTWAGFAVAAGMVRTGTLPDAVASTGTATSAPPGPFSALDRTVTAPASSGRLPPQLQGCIASSGRLPPHPHDCATASIGASTSWLELACTALMALLMSSFPVRNRLHASGSCSGHGSALASRAARTPSGSGR